jgi:EAL domain-containing protein (putative c-di-GMP-specific phosphodiesterase class I)
MGTGDNRLNQATKTGVRCRSILAHRLLYTTQDSSVGALKIRVQWRILKINHIEMNQEKKLFPYFQPIVGAASGSIIGYEALARQHNANGKVISAGELFSSPDIAPDQLIAWDRMVRRQALERFNQSNFNGYLTLNISAAWIDRISDFNSLPTLLMLEEFNIDRKRIIIEITESKGDLDKLVEIAAVYRKHGLKIAIDDFGAGFSQLERVMAIQPDIIKLDMQLFQNATKGGIASDIVHLISRLAKRTGCRIVCEGVETADDFHFGLSCGAQYMQGYLFSPATAEFKEPLHYQQQIGALRKTFLKKKLSQRRTQDTVYLQHQGLDRAAEKSPGNRF